MSKVYHIGPRKSFEPLPTGDYVMTLKSWRIFIEEQDSAFSKKGDEKIEWTFTIAVPNDDDTERHVRAAPPATWNEKSVFVKIAQALRLVDGQKAAENGADIDWDQAIGRRCIGTILKSLKTGSTTEYTDSIKAYAPFVPLVEPAAKAAANGLATPEQYERVRAMIRFDDEQANAENIIRSTMPLTDLVFYQRQLGTQPMSQHAKDWLTQAAQLLAQSGGSTHDISAALTGSLKDGFLLYDKILQETDALGTF